MSGNEIRKILESLNTVVKEETNEKYNDADIVDKLKWAFVNYGKDTDWPIELERQADGWIFTVNGQRFFIKIIDLDSANKNESLVETKNKCKCGKPGKKPHPCPYRADINDDSKTLCNCCDACRRECAEDI
jgi:hypothetical protein